MICKKQSVLQETIRYTHGNAAGCSLPARSLETFFECSNYDLKDYDFNESEYLVNFMRDASDLDIIDIINDISNAGGIWGQGSPEPLIYIKNIPLSNIKIMGSNKDTLKIEYKGIAYMKFHAKDLIEEISNGNKIDIIGRANLNEWNGMVTPQIFIDAYEVKNERDLGF